MNGLHHHDEPDSDDRKLWSKYQQHIHAAAVLRDSEFQAAMNKAIGKGREKVKAGTFVDPSPPVGLRRLIAPLPISACGSPAAMCMNSGGSQNGAETMR